jgi:hypothetical protein
MVATVLKNLHHIEARASTKMYYPLPYVAILCSILLLIGEEETEDRGADREACRGDIHPGNVRKVQR